ncbi:hypothetical protein CFOL_v3_33199 [Cephalotus follicularis]|uniref:Uncharacterized protein n=1 Tax=Cephalotus follicularis TaxID=3775 RepID=A0A1Q3DB81_CEPFO|nr:hypothetical protein CFOL_v3_33199 [Cephalotus follicularis]
MAGLLAWAADVVGGHGNQSNEEDDSKIPILFTVEQQKYVEELDHKATTLSRSIRDLRLRLPPPDISQRLPHLHAHSLASNAAFALQLNSHTATREQVQLREVTLQEENAAYEKAISNFETRIQEKMQEEDSLRTKLKDMEEIEENLRADLENARTALTTSQSGGSSESMVESELIDEAGVDTAHSKSDILDKLEIKKKELSSMEDVVQGLERKWAQIQDKALRQPSPAQREKVLDKQLHSLVEQLAAKQAQAEGLANEIHLKGVELERLNGLWRSQESINIELNNARNRFGRNTFEKGSASTHYDVDGHHKYYAGGRNESQQKLMLLRSAFLLYILMLHVVVFIKISF